MELPELNPPLEVPLSAREAFSFQGSDTLGYGNPQAPTTCKRARRMRRAHAEPCVSPHNAQSDAPRVRLAQQIARCEGRKRSGHPLDAPFSLHNAAFRAATETSMLQTTRCEEESLSFSDDIRNSPCTHARFRFLESNSSGHEELAGCGGSGLAFPVLEHVRHSSLTRCTYTAERQCEIKEQSMGVSTYT